MSAIEQLTIIALQAEVKTEFAKYLSRASSALTPVEVEIAFSNVLDHIQADWWGLDLIAKNYMHSGPTPAECKAFEIQLAHQKLQAFFEGCLRLYPNNCCLLD